MSWYEIVLFVIFYIVMWIITAIVLSRWSNNTNPEWVYVGLVWPFILCACPLIFLINIVGEIVNKYGYKEDKNHE